MLRYIPLFLFSCLSVVGSAQRFQWQPTKTIAAEGPITGMYSGPESLYIGIPGQGFFYSSDLGVTWDSLNQGLSSTAIIDIEVQNDTIWALTASSGPFFLSPQSGKWKANSKGLPDYLRFIDFEIDGGSLFLGTESGLYKLNLKSNEWEYLKVPFTNTLNRTILEVLVDGTNIIAGGRGIVYLSSDNGLSWRLLERGVHRTNIDVIKKIDEKYLIIGSSDEEIFLNNQLKLVSIHPSRFRDQGEFKFSDYLISGDSVLLRSTANIGFLKGEGRFNAGVSKDDEEIIVRKLALHKGYFFAATMSHGLLIFDEVPEELQLLVEEVTLDVADRTKPLGLFLHPNPVADVLNIGLTLSDSQENLTVLIIDEQGKIVKRLVDGITYSSGQYSLFFNTTTLQAGTYYCKVFSNNSSLSQAFVITK